MIVASMLWPAANVKPRRKVETANYRCMYRLIIDPHGKLPEFRRLTHAPPSCHLLSLLRVTQAHRLNDMQIRIPPLKVPQPDAVNEMQGGPCVGEARTIAVRLPQGKVASFTSPEGGVPQRFDPCRQAGDLALHSPSPVVAAGGGIRNSVLIR